MAGGILRTRGEMRRRVKDLIEYVSNNYDWIQNIPLVGGYGSGPIEKTVDITVARRFKKRGMSWYKSGANPLLRRFLPEFFFKFIYQRFKSWVFIFLYCNHANCCFRLKFFLFHFVLPVVL